MYHLPKVSAQDDAIKNAFSQELSHVMSAWSADLTHRARTGFPALCHQLVLQQFPHSLQAKPVSSIVRLDVEEDVQPCVIDCGEKFQLGAYPFYTQQTVTCYPWGTQSINLDGSCCRWILRVKERMTLPPACRVWLSGEDAAAWLYVLTHQVTDFTINGVPSGKQGNIRWGCEFDLTQLSGIFSAWQWYAHFPERLLWFTIDFPDRVIQSEEIVNIEIHFCDVLLPKKKPNFVLQACSMENACFYPAVPWVTPGGLQHHVLQVDADQADECCILSVADLKGFDIYQQKQTQFHPWHHHQGQHRFEHNIGKNQAHLMYQSPDDLALTMSAQLLCCQGYYPLQCDHSLPFSHSAQEIACQRVSDFSRYVPIEMKNSEGVLLDLLHLSWGELTSVAPLKEALNTLGVKQAGSLLSLSAERRQHIQHGGLVSRLHIKLLMSFHKFSGVGDAALFCRILFGYFKHLSKHHDKISLDVCFSDSEEVFAFYE